MEINGDNLIDAPQDRVWAGLNDPEVLRRSIPGCESLEKIGDDKLKATVVTRIGPITAKFNGEVELTELQPPHSYVIIGSGSAGPMGSAKGKAHVALLTEGSQTRLTYRVEVDVTGRIAQLGGRLIQSTAAILAKQFFDKFDQAISSPAEAGPASEAAVPASATPRRSAGGKWALGAVAAVVLLAIVYVALR